tara:strand:- start:1747 stop:1902 length:156 start_codon:yes stop_codon:yes gene_type:complete
MGGIEAWRGLAVPRLLAAFSRNAASVLFSVEGMAGRSIMRARRFSAPVAEW